MFRHRSESGRPQPETPEFRLVQRVRLLSGDSCRHFRGGNCGSVGVRGMEYDARIQRIHTQAEQCAANGNGNDSERRRCDT